MLVACHQHENPTNAADVDSLTIPECIVSAVPDSLGYDKFYTKYVDVNGLPLVSSAQKTRTLTASSKP